MTSLLSKMLLWFSAEYIDLTGLCIVFSSILSNIEKAASDTKKIGFPVVIKVNSNSISHKTDVKGVITNIDSETKLNKSLKNIKDKYLNFNELYYYFKNVSINSIKEQLKIDQSVHLFFCSLKTELIAVHQQEYLEIVSDKDIEKYDQFLLKLEETQWLKKFLLQFF